MNLRVVGNSQARQEVVSAAQAAIELTISTPLFSSTRSRSPPAAIPIDVDGDAQPDYQAQLTPAPACYRVRVLKVNELDPGIEGDRACLGSSTSPNPGIETAGSTPRHRRLPVRRQRMERQRRGQRCAHQCQCRRQPRRRACARLTTDTASACP